MITLSCGQCGHVADLDLFCKTPVFGYLPKGHYQCPSCSYAFKRVHSEYRILKSGSDVTFYPGCVELVQIGGRL